MNEERVIVFGSEKKKQGLSTVQIYWPDGGQSVRDPNGQWQVNWSDGSWVPANKEHAIACTKSLLSWSRRKQSKV